MKNYYIPTQHRFRFVSNALFILCFVFFAGFTANAQITTNSGSGLAPTYPNLGDAITALNLATITSPVVITVDPSQPQTAPAGGYEITAQGTAVNTITLNGGGNTVTASAAQVAGNLNDAIIKIIGGDYITIQGFTLLEDAANSTTTAGTNNMTEFGIALFYASDTNGAQNNTIQNNTITLKRIYQNSFGIYSNTRHTATSMTVAADITNVSGANSFNKVYANTISDVNFGTVFIGSGALTINGFMDNGTDIGGSSAATGNTYTNWGGIGIATSLYVSLTTSNYCIFVNNTYNENISFNTITSAAAVSAITTGGILKNYSSGATVQPTGTITTNINNNTVTITNSPITATGGTIIGIINGGLTPLLSTATVNINNNVVQNCVLGGSAATTTGMTCITNQSAAGMVNMTGNSVINNAITATTSTSGTLAGIGNSAAVGTVNITSNIVRGMSNSATTTGQFQGLINSGPVVTAVNINNNQLGNASGGLYSSSAATNSGVFFGIVNAGAAATCALSIQNNDFRGVTLTNALATVCYFINLQGANSPLTQNISNNTFTNLSINSTGTIMLITITASVGIPAGGSQTISGNSIVGTFNKTVSSVNSVRGIYSGNSGTPNVNVTSTWNNNNFSNISVVGATPIFVILNIDTGLTNRSITNNTVNNITGGTADVNGILIQNGGGNGGAGNVVSGNTISNMTNTSGFVTGILSFLGTQTSIFKNKIFGLSGTGATSFVDGILVASGTTNTIYNNLIGNLTTPNANAANAIRGLNINGGTTVNAYFNSVYLDASSTGALFGSSAISAVTTVNLTLENNIFVNNSTTTGGGLAVAYRRSDTNLSTYQAASNNNLLYSSSGNLFTDGTNTDATIGDYKTRVAPSDATSFTENPNFLSIVGSNADFLHINPAIATLIESGGVAIAGITDDYDGNTRNGIPDVGADEFTGIQLTVCNGANGGTAVGDLTNCGPVTSPSISASGFSSGLVSTYQWQSSNDNFVSNIVDISGQNAPGALITGLISSTTSYRLRVTCNTGLATAFSNPITVTITPIPEAPTGLFCWETATLNTSTCTWSVSGTQPTQPTVINTTLASEGFNDITTLTGAGWSLINTSVPLGSTNWIQGATFPAQAGASTACIGANFNNTTGTNTISNWLIAPQTTLQNGDVIKFWTRTVSSVSFPDRLQVRLSTSGAGTAPTSPTDIGSYTNLLLDINPTLTTTGYPNAWTEYSVTVSGLSGPTSSRVAFRYFVTLGGPTGDNSDFIGIDTFSITRSTPLACYQSYVFNNTSCVWDLTTNAIDYANLQWQPTNSMTVGGTFTSYGQFYEGGLTDVIPNIVGQAPGVDVEFGISPVGDNSNPSTWSNWSTASWNSAHVSNNDEYFITTGSALAVGTYYYTFRYRFSCDGGSPWQYGGYPNGFWNGTSQNSGVLTVTAPTSSVVNLKLFVEGYYQGAGLMATVQNNQDFPDYLLPANTNVETITLELRDATTTALVTSANAMLQTNGNATFTFPSAPSGSFYLAVKTRTTVQTWSNLPQAVGASPLTYDFTTAASQAYLDNQAALGGGVFGFFSGDINSNGAQDDEINAADYSEWEADSNALLFGSYATDLNGDGEINATDYSIWETNANGFVFALYPPAP